MTVDYTRELAVATAAAQQAGVELLRYFRGELKVERKADASPVTAADRASEAVVLGALREAFPDDGILSEEQASGHRAWTAHRRCWVVDPLDGTRDFIEGREGFSVMIGLLVDAKPTLGVVHQPVVGRTYRYAPGAGADVLDAEGRSTPLSPSTRVPPEPIRLVASYSHRSPKVGEAKALLGIEDELMVGSVGVKIGLIASDQRDLYLNPDGHCKLWDTCAPEAIIVGAGGRMTDFSGQPLVYDDPARLRLDAGIIASNGACHDVVVERLAPVFERG